MKFFNALPSSVVERSTVLGASFQINYTNVTMQRTLTSKLKTNWHLQVPLETCVLNEQKPCF